MRIYEASFCFREDAQANPSLHGWRQAVFPVGAGQTCLTLRKPALFSRSSTTRVLYLFHLLETSGNGGGAGGRGLTISIINEYSNGHGVVDGDTSWCPSYNAWRKESYDTGASGYYSNQ